MTNSPQSDITERMSSPVMAVHSRLVSFGKQRTVTVTPSAGDRRSASQTAVVDTDEGSPGAHSVHTRESDGSGETTPVARPRMPITPVEAVVLPSHRSGSIKSGKKRHQHTRSRGSSISRSRSPTPPMPDSFPSLPALPTAYSLASAKSAKSIASHRTNQSSTQIPQTRVLLGVNEPFHFYPPLMLASPTLASTATTFTEGYTADGKPVTPEGATYAVYGEHGSGLVEMPDWLHFEEMELWGVPGDDARGRWDIRVVERRRGEKGERVVGRFALEVSRSPLSAHTS